MDFLELLLQCCGWEDWRQARDEDWISCGQPASKQEDEKQSPFPLYFVTLMDDCISSLLLSLHYKGR